MRRLHARAADQIQGKTAQQIKKRPKNFGVSKNFIYMEDDFFIGKYLKKADFFYYDKSFRFHFSVFS